MKVVHIVRKRSQLDSSFIYNQILNHREFEPAVIFAYDDGTRGLADFPFEKVPATNLSWVYNLYSKIRILYLFYPGKKQRSFLRNTLAELKPDVIHLHYGSDAALFLPTIHDLNLPTVVSFYGYDCTGFPAYYMGLGRSILKRKVFPFAACFTAMSQVMKDDLEALGCPGGKIHVHYHGIDTSLFQLTGDKMASDRFRLIIISSLTAQKGHLFLLRAFREVVRKKPHTFLRIVGEGPEKGKIEAYIRDYGIPNIQVSDFVRFASPDHHRYLSEADLFVHPSVTDGKGNKEGIPGALVEAMAAGLPVISTRHAGIPSVVMHRSTGLLVQENDTEALTEAILELQEDIDLRKKLGENAREYATRHLDILVKEAALENLYRKTMEEHQG